IALVTFLLILYVAWDKIQLYFLQSITGEVEEDLIARFVLYATSLEIFKDYFPFGSGLASFATHASGAYYSDIYVEYGISHVWGISNTGWDFIADTYYPSLAQFGVAGVFLFIIFWLYIIRKTFLFFLKYEIAKYFVISVLITGYLLIENIADASFTSNRGFFMMMLLGTIMTELRKKEIDTTSKETEIEKGKTIKTLNI
ncbi:O-antigen ligase domain-containing protein, partial [Parabacteroides sp. OttesenSCG-928-G07]|nr:O-antigen ligase domain-containing protein [Parabacteroides sp. OttesenSCG-928-G07]